MLSCHTASVAPDVIFRSGFPRFLHPSPTPPPSFRTLLSAHRQASKAPECLQAQKQLQEVKQQLSEGLMDNPRAAGLKGALQQTPILARAASNSPRATTDSPRGLATPSPFSSSRDAGGAQTAPEGTTGAEGSCGRKPFLRRRSRHVPVSQR